MPAMAVARTVLLDTAGTPVGRYERLERDGAVYADLFTREPGVTVQRAADAVLGRLRGMRIAGDEPLGRALIAAGGRPIRHAHLMSRDLEGNPAPERWPEPPGARLTDVDRPAADLVDAFRAAYPPGHPDHRVETRQRSLADLETWISGRDFGPLLAGSGLAIARDGSVAGAILLGTLPGDPPENGPWVIELFRHPAHRGIGRPLLQRALALATVPALGLIVTEGNPARALYEDLGFRLVLTTLVVQI
jgi:GNAT superfamily N-acetyltransferase